MAKVSSKAYPSAKIHLTSLKSEKQKLYSSHQLPVTVKPLPAAPVLPVTVYIPIIQVYKQVYWSPLRGGLASGNSLSLLLYCSLKLFQENEMETEIQFLLPLCRPWKRKYNFPRSTIMSRNFPISSHQEKFSFKRQEIFRETRNFVDISFLMSRNFSLM